MSALEMAWPGARKPRAAARISMGAGADRLRGDGVWRAKPHGIAKDAGRSGSRARPAVAPSYGEQRTALSASSLEIAREELVTKNVAFTPWRTKSSAKRRGRRQRRSAGSPGARARAARPAARGCPVALDADRGLPGDGDADPGQSPRDLTYAEVVITTPAAAPIVYRVAIPDPRATRTRSRWTSPRARADGRRARDSPRGHYERLPRVRLRAARLPQLYDHPTRAGARAGVSGSTRALARRGAGEAAGHCCALPLFAFGQGVRTSFLDDSHAYWNSTNCSSSSIAELHALPRRRHAARHASRGRPGATDTPRRPMRGAF